MTQADARRCSRSSSGITLVMTYWAAGRSTSRPRFLHGPPRDRRHSKRLGDRRRLHVCGVVSRALPAWSRSTASTGSCIRSAGSSHISPCCCWWPSRCAIPASYTVADVIVVPAARARRPRDRGGLHAHHHALLHDSPDGRQPDRSSTCLVQRHRRNLAIVIVGIADARLRAVRRHARDDVGADHQGRALACSVDRAESPCACPLRFLTFRVSRCGDVRERGRPYGGSPAYGALLLRSAGRVRSRLARHCARARHGGTPAHLDALFHCSNREARRALRSPGRWSSSAHFIS